MILIIIVNSEVERISWLMNMNEILIIIISEKWLIVTLNHNWFYIYIYQIIYIHGYQILHTFNYYYICLTHLSLINIIQFFYRIVQLRESAQLSLILIPKVILLINYQKIILTVVDSFLPESYWQKSVSYDIT